MDCIRFGLLAMKISVFSTLQLVAPILLTAQTTTIHVRVVDGRTGASLSGMKLALVDYHNGKSGVDHDDLNGRKFVTTSAVGDLYIATPDVQGVIVFNGMGRDRMWTTCSNQKFYDSTSRTYGSEYLYPVSAIMNSGMVTKNRCGKVSEAAKAGELVIFIRPTTWWERFVAGMRS